MRKYRRKPQVVFAQRFSNKGLKENFEKTDVIVKVGKSYHITASASYCPTLDDYRGQNFRFHGCPKDNRPIEPGDWIVRDERGSFTILSDDDFQQLYAPVVAKMKMAKKKEKKREFGFHPPHGADNL